MFGGAQKIPFSYYYEMSDDEVLSPVSQQGERKDEFSSWAPARAMVVASSTDLLLWNSCGPSMLTHFLQSCFPSELCSFVFSPSTHGTSLLLMARFGGTAKFNCWGFFVCLLTTKLPADSKEKSVKQRDSSSLGN